MATPDFPSDQYPRCQRDHFNAIASDQSIVEYYLPAFRAIVQSNAVSSVMCSYPSINGRPACGNSLFLTELLRNTWNFSGYVVSDCGAISDPAFSWFVNRSLGGSVTARVGAAMKSGCDIGCDPWLNDFAKEALFDGTITESTLNTALTRLYSSFVKLGSLDEGSDGGHSCKAFSGIGPEAIDTPLHRQISLEGAIQSIILLQNRGKLLPLAPTTSVALLGPHLNSTQAMISIYHMDMEGIYSVLAEKHSPLMAITAHPHSHVVGHEVGCTDGVACLNVSGFANAAKLAKSADVAIVFVGLIPGHAEMPAPVNESCDAREDEGKDRPYTTLPGRQEELIQAVVAANPKTVVVLIHGMPPLIELTRTVQYREQRQSVSRVFFPLRSA